MKYSRSFYMLWSGQSLGVLSDVLFTVALTAAVYVQTNSATATSLIPLSSSIARLISGFIAPLVIEKVPSRKLLVLSQAVKAIIVIAFLFLNITASLLPIIVSVVVLLAIFEGFISPTRSSLLPRVVNKEKIVNANSLISTTDSTLYLAGWMVGGALVSLLGSTVVLWMTAPLMALAAILYQFIKVSSISVQNEKRSVIKTIQEGWVILWKNKLIRGITGMNISEGLANGVWTGAILLVYVQEFLNQDEAWWGFLNSSYYIGYILGSIITLKLSSVINNHLGKTIIIGGSLMAFLTVLLAFIPNPWIALLICVLMGTAYQARDISQNVIFQLSLEESQLAKVYASSGTLISAISGVAILIMGFVSDLFGVAMAFIAAGVLYSISAIIGLMQGKLRIYSQPNNSTATNM
ncbi:MFS transporter [Bacillus sp. AK128]